MTTRFRPYSTPSRIAAVVLIASTSLLLVPSALAASGSWTGNNSGAWSDAGNWSASPAPTAADTATFNGTGNANTILAIDLGRIVKSINFDTSVVAYTIGSAGANTGNTLGLAKSGTISLLATATGINLTQTFNAPISLGGNYTFTNARADTGSSLVFAGNITNSATSTLSLTGAGTGTGNLISGNISDGTGVQSLTISATAGKWTLSGANTYGGLTSITGNGVTVVTSGTNSSAGATTLNQANATLQLNNATNGGLATGLLTLTAGTLQALNATRTLSNTVALAGNVIVSGDQSINFTGKISGGSSSRTLTNNIDSGKTLTLSAVDVSSDTTNRSLTIAGTGNTTITGVIANGNGTTANGITVTNTGITTFTGASSYTGATTLNGGTTILDATGTAASLNSASTLTFGGGGFVFKGDNSGTAQTLGAVTLNASSGSSLGVIAGTAGTTLNLGAFTNAGLLNITLDSTNGAAAVTTTTTLTNSLFNRGNVTLTIGGVTEFATIDGSNFITQYTGQTAFVSTGASTSTNYILTGSSSITAASLLQVATLKITPTGAGQSLDLNGKVFQLANSGLLFTGAYNYEIKDSAGTGQFNGGGGGNTALNIHQFGTGILTISADIVSPSGNATLSITGPGTTVLSGTNVYAGNTYFGGGATVSINASSTLGASSSARTLSLSNATLRATETFSLVDGANARLIALGANGGTIDVTTGKTLTAPGVISGVGSLAKTGAGTFEVSGVNTYTGTTTVNTGTLLVSGTGSINGSSAVAVTATTAKLKYDSSVALTSNVTVTNGGTFAYNSSADYTGAFTQTNGKLGGTNWNGSLAGLTIGANQTITPGNSVGSATSTTQTWASGGSYDFEINKADGTAGLTAGGWDLLTLSGALNITATSGSTFNLNVISLGLDNLAGNATGFTNTSNYAWLITDTGSTITSFAGSAFTINTTGFSNANGGIWALALGNTGSIGGTDQQLFLTYTATVIPEPSTYAALLGTLGLLLASTRRRNR